MSDIDEIAKIKAIKKDLLSLDCPHIDITEDDLQIKNLLLENSNYRQELVKWLLETLTDSVEINLGGFHLHLLVFPFIYQFESRIEALVCSSFAND